MKTIHFAVISIVLVALLTLTACAPGWGQPRQGGMMGGQGGMTGSQGTPGAPGTSQQPYPYGPGGRMGPGMMGPGGMMGSGMMGPGGMMGGSSTYNPDAEQITIDAAAEAVERYLRAYYGQNLVLVEVMEFTRNFYAEIEEEDTDVHAMELLIDKYTGQVYPEMGPNMMWNTKYDHMAGMMGNYYGSGSPTADMPVTEEEAKKLAQQWLDVNLPGVTADEAEVFYGYYTSHTLKDGQIEGMLSVNGYNGAVWYHSWHGPFIGMEEFE